VLGQKLSAGSTVAALSSHKTEKEALEEEAMMQQIKAPRRRTTTFVSSYRKITISWWYGKSQC
jgi:hypothetical protein